MGTSDHVGERFCIAGPLHGQIRIATPDGYRPETIKQMSPGVVTEINIYYHVGDPAVDRLVSRLYEAARQTQAAVPIRRRKAVKPKRKTTRRKSR